MSFVLSVIGLLIASFILAYRSMKAELSAPKEVSGLKIKRKEKISGVILFLKKKVVHYSSASS